ncbi:hypothetical protein LMG24235_08586 [Paraburkholderia sabiae]|nr:hypothetical protein LMG24235_08586 [Paraburkholderia sabiae]
MSKLKSLDELFAGRHFDRDVIILCVRWYLRYKLSLRDLVEMMAERGLRWPTRRSCAGCGAFRRSSSNGGIASAGPPASPSVLTRLVSSCVASGSIFIGRWIPGGRRWTSRSVQSATWRRQKPFSGRQSDIRASHRRASRLTAMRSHRAVREMKVDGLLAEDTKIRSSKYLNNLVEQDHRNIKSRTKVMLGCCVNLTEPFIRLRNDRFAIALDDSCSNGAPCSSVIQLSPALHSSSRCGRPP